MQKVQGNLDNEGGTGNPHASCPHVQCQKCGSHFEQKILLEKHRSQPQILANTENRPSIIDKKLESEEEENVDPPAPAPQLATGLIR